MGDPMPPVDLDDALAAEQEVIRALKRAPPGETIEQARMRCCKLIDVQSRRIASDRGDAVTSKRTNGSNGHAPPVEDIFTEEILTALAKGIVPFVREAIAEVTTPLEARTTELENVVRALVQSAAGRHE